MGIGGQLTKLRLDQIDPNLFQHVVLARVQAETPYEYCQSRFSGHGYSDISARRTDGSVRTDRRYFYPECLVLLDYERKLR